MRRDEDAIPSGDIFESSFPAEIALTLGSPRARQSTPTLNSSQAACEREGDPDDTLCRMEKVKNPRRANATMHNILREYFAQHSPVAPKVEGRITATDAPQTLLSQLEGYDYEFR